MTKRIQNAVNKIATILSTGLEANQIYLFGSQATNSANKDSDIDIFVVANLKNKKKIEQTQLARRMLLKQISLPIDILICDSEEFEKKKTIQSSFEHIIYSEGIKIYG
jgi:predicted nucleotidyltransferase